MKFTECPEFKLKIEFLDGHTEIYIHCMDYYLNDISGIYHITYWDGWKYVYTQINRELIKKISTTEKQQRKAVNMYGKNYQILYRIRLRRWKW